MEILPCSVVNVEVGWIGFILEQIKIIRAFGTTAAKAWTCIMSTYYWVIGDGNWSLVEGILDKSSPKKTKKSW